MRPNVYGYGTYLGLSSKTNPKSSVKSTTGPLIDESSWVFVDRQKNKLFLTIVSFSHKRKTPAREYRGKFPFLWPTFGHSRTSLHQMIEGGGLHHLEPRLMIGNPNQRRQCDLGCSCVETLGRK